MTDLWVSWHGVDGLCVVRVAPSAGRRVDVTHHPVTSRHDRAEWFCQLFLLLTIFSSPVLKPDLKQESRWFNTQILYEYKICHKILFFRCKVGILNDFPLPWHSSQSAAVLKYTLRKFYTIHAKSTFNIIPSTTVLTYIVSHNLPHKHIQYHSKYSCAKIYCSYNFI